MLYNNIVETILYFYSIPKKKEKSEVKSENSFWRQGNVLQCILAAMRQWTRLNSTGHVLFSYVFSRLEKNGSKSVMLC